MTQILLTEDLKQIMLDQYHPYINIDLWSMEQEEYENNNYIFKDIDFTISKEDINSFFDNTSQDNDYDLITIIPDNSITIYKDKFYTRNTSTVYKDFDNFTQDNFYFISFEAGVHTITVRYYDEENENNAISESTFTIDARKSYQKTRFVLEDVIDISSLESYGISMDNINDKLTKFSLEIPTSVLYLGDTPDDTILNPSDGNYISVSDKMMIDLFTFVSSETGAKTIDIEFYKKTGGHNNVTEECVDEDGNAVVMHNVINVLSDVDRDTLPIVQNEPVNVRIVENDVKKMLSSEAQAKYSKYVNTTNYNNIIFTPENNNTIIPYEYHKGVFYLRLPSFYKTISMHILPKNFDAMDDNVILLNTKEIIDIVNNDKTHTWTPSTGVLRTETAIDVTNATDSQVSRYLIPLPKNIQALNTLEIDFISKYKAEHTLSQIGVIDVNERGYSSSELKEKYKKQQTLIRNISTLANPSVTAITAKRRTNDIYSDSSYQYMENPNSTNKFSPQAISLNTTQDGMLKYINDNLYTEHYNNRGSSNVVNRKAELQTNNVYNYFYETWSNDKEVNNDV